MTSDGGTSGRPRARRASPPSRRARAAGSRGQLNRLLSLVPYLQERGEISIHEAAAEFGVRPATIRRDIGVLMFCGLPGLGMGDLIEVDFDALEEDGVLRVSNADYLSRPLRLDSNEAAALLVALRVLAEGSGPAEREVIARTLSKIEAAAGDAASVAARLDVRTAPDAAERRGAEVRGRLEEAIRAGRQVRLRHWSAARDEVGERVVDPVAVLEADGRTYLDAWCHRAEDRRLFRLDRIEAAEVLPTASPAGRRRRPVDLAEGIFRPSPDQLLASVRLSPEARWVTEYYPVESAEEAEDGGLLVTLRVGDAGWLVRLMLRLGGRAVLLEPAELADRVREAARAAIAAYEDHRAAPEAAYDGAGPGPDRRRGTTNDEGDGHGQPRAD